MSDTSTAPDPGPLVPAGERFLSFLDLKAAHTRLQSNRQFRDPEGHPQPALLDAAEEFVRRAAATGQVLATDAERESAQRLVTFWSNFLYRAGRDLAGEDALAEFDAGQAPDLSGIQCPYAGLGEVPAAEAWRFAAFRRTIQQCISLLRHNRLGGLTAPGHGGAGGRRSSGWPVRLCRPGCRPTRSGPPSGRNRSKTWPCVFPAGRPGGAGRVAPAGRPALPALRATGRPARRPPGPAWRSGGRSL